MLGRVQHTTAFVNYESSKALPFGSDVTADSFLVAVVEISCGDLDVPITASVSDDVNGAWTRADRVTNLLLDPHCDCELSIWYLDAAAGSGATTVTADFGGTPGYGSMVTCEYSGVPFPVVIDAVAQYAHTGTSHTSGPATTDRPCLLLGAFGDAGNNDLLSIGTLWTLADKVDEASLGQAMLGDRGVGSLGVPAGSYSATCSNSSGQLEGSILLAVASGPVPAPPSVPRNVLVESGPLGRGEHRVFVFGRGGKPFVGEVGFTSLSYSRRLDDKSTANVTIGAGTSSFLGDLRGWKHELLIVRDDEPAWLGPIHEPAWEPSTVTLPADDLLGWLDNRDIAEDLTMKDVDLATVFARLVHDGMAREPSPGLHAAASLSGVIGTRSYVAAQHQAVGDALRSLGQAGVDYCCILRRLHIGDLVSLPAITLTDDTLLSPKVTEGKAASKITVVGATTANIGKPVEARAGGANEELGLLEKTINDSDVMTHDGADHYARDAYAFLNPAPLYVSGVLAPSAPVGIEDLIPGMPVDARLTGLDREVDARCRLLQIDVNVRPSEQGQQETVAVTLVPVGLEG